MTDHAYKLLTPAEWAAFGAVGSFAGAPVDLADGYVHLSTAAQLGGTLAKHFGDHDRLVLAEVDLAALGDAVQWEPARGGALFPHVYAALPLSSVRRSWPLVRDTDAGFVLPTDLVAEPVQ